MNIGSGIKDLRKKNGYTQKEFAKLCELSQTYLSQIENNLKEPSISTLKAITQKLNIPLPLFIFLSLDENDISEDKKGVYELIAPSLRSLISKLLNNDSFD